MENHLILNGLATAVKSPPINFLCLCVCALIENGSWLSKTTEKGNNVANPGASRFDSETAVYRNRNHNTSTKEKLVYRKKILEKFTFYLY